MYVVSTWCGLGSDRPWSQCKGMKMVIIWRCGLKYLGIWNGRMLGRKCWWWGVIIASMGKVWLRERELRGGVWR